MSRPLKRARTAAPRPISKTLLFFHAPITGGTTVSTIYSTTFPCTITGLRWELSTPAHVAQGAPNGYVNWAIVLVKQGNTASTLPTGSQPQPLNMYVPEQNVLASGSATLSPTGTGEFNAVWKGQTKTMRKMQLGDNLQIVFGMGTNDPSLEDTVFGGSIQFFCKS